jgi:hypothetical protein
VTATRGLPSRKTSETAMLYRILYAAAPPPSDTARLVAIIDRATVWLVGIIAAVATLYLTLGGVRYLLAGGDPQTVAAQRSARLCDRRPGTDHRWHRQVDPGHPAMGSIAGSLLNDVLTWLAEQLGRILDWLWNILSTVVFVSPDVSGLPQIQHATGLSRAVANAAMVLLIAVIGALHVLTGASQRSSYTLRTLGPRFVVAILAANLSTVIVSASIAAANAVTAALTGADFSSQQAIAQIRAHLASIGQHPENLLLEFVLQNCLTVALAALLITWMVRIGQLIIVAGIAPIALLCHTFPATQVVAEGWWRTLAGALITQVLQAVTLTLAWTTLMSPDASLPVIVGLPVDPHGAINLALTAFLTAQVALIPRYVRRTLRAGPGGGSTVGALFRMLVVQQVVGGLRRVGRGRAMAAGGPRSTMGTAVHHHTAGERQVTQLFGENAVQHTHTHEGGSHQYQHHHIHQTPAPKPATWRPSRASSPAGLRLRRSRS